MANIEELITEQIDVWTTAIKRKSSSGRGSSKKIQLYGVKKLRELILDLAVRGLLVPQDSNDEPASELLKHITAKKAKLLEQGKIKNQKLLPPITKDDIPHSLPKSWVWARLGDITNYGLAQKAEAEAADANTWVLELEDVEKETSLLLQKIRFTERAFKSSKNIFYKGGVIYGKLRPYLDKVLVADENGVCTTEMMPVRAYAKLIPEFLRFAMKSPHFKDYANNSTHGMNLPRMGTDKARLAIIPLCSEKEQHRIVAKVNELMALCDQLEQQSEASITAHQLLVESLLSTLTQSSSTAPTPTAQHDNDQATTHNTLKQDWQRIAEHFDTLFTTEQSIELLQQCILQLAVMGKLVPQDPNDEPAETLYKRFTAVRDKFLKDESENNREASTMIRKLCKLNKPIHPFKLPATWTCAHLIQLSQMLVDCHNKTAPYTTTGIPIIRTTNIKNRCFTDKDLKFVDQETYEYWSRRCPPSSGDIMFTREAPMGEALIVPEKVKWCLGQRTMLIRPNQEYVSSQYLLLALTEPHLLERASEHAIGSTVKHLRVGDVENLAIPLPPLAEQNRIVAKFDELMAICGLLKTRLADAQNTQMQLADAVTEQAIG